MDIMNNLTGIKMTYFSPAYPPKNIYMNWVYELGFDEHGSYIFDGNLIQHLEFSLIKQLFAPSNYNWFEVDEILKKRKEKKDLDLKMKEIAKNNLYKQYKNRR
jgi:hypothetical protein